MGLKYIGGDTQFGYMGLGSMQLSAADTFSAAMLTALIEPDLIISNKSGPKLLEIDVKEVLVWDCKRWHVHSNGVPIIVSGEDDISRSVAGLTKDNTVDGSQAPTADTIAQGTQSGGAGASVVGDADGGGTGEPITVGDEQPTRFVDRFEFYQVANEQQSAVGHINMKYTQEIVRENPAYIDEEGQQGHLLLTGNHYHLWANTLNMTVVPITSVGMLTRRVSVDLLELMFDRAVLLSILDAIVVSR